MGPAGPIIKNDSAGEYQQLFTRQMLIAALVFRLCISMGNKRKREKYFLCCNAMCFGESPAFRSKYAHIHRRKLSPARKYEKQEAWAFSELHIVTAQDIMVLFTVPFVRTSNPKFKTDLL